VSEQGVLTPLLIAQARSVALLSLAMGQEESPLPQTQNFKKIATGTRYLLINLFLFFDNSDIYLSQNL
jgi:hypothetical protein